MKQKRSLICFDCRNFCRGQPPSAADLHFLENAKKLAMYGVDIHPAQVTCHRFSHLNSLIDFCRTRKVLISTLAFQQVEY